MRGVARRYPSSAVVTLALLLCASSATRADGLRGMDYFKAGKYAEAAAEFQSLVDQSPSYDYGYYMLGNSFLRMKRLEEAQRNFEQAIALRGDRFEYHNGLASVLTALRNYRQSIAILNRAEGLVTTAGYRYVFYSHRGFAYASLDLWTDALPDLERALSIRRTKPVLDQTGKAYYVLRSVDKAIPFLEESFRLDPNDPQTAEILTHALLELGADTRDEPRKRKIYQEAVRVAGLLRQLRPESHVAVDLHGQAVFGAGYFGIAEKVFRRVLEMKADYCYAMINLGKVYIAEDRLKEAEKSLLDAGRCAPRMAVVPLILGFVYQKENRLEDALAQFKSSLELEPSNAAREGIRGIESRIERPPGNP